MTTWGWVVLLWSLSTCISCTFNVHMYTAIYMYYKHNTHLWNVPIYSACMHIHVQLTGNCVQLPHLGQKWIAGCYCVALVQCMCHIHVGSCTRLPMSCMCMHEAAAWDCRRVVCACRVIGYITICCTLCSSKCHRWPMNSLGSCSFFMSALMV